MSSAIPNTSTFDTNGSDTTLVTESVQRDNIFRYLFALAKYKQLSGLVLAILILILSMATQASPCAECNKSRWYRP